MDYYQTDLLLDDSQKEIKKSVREYLDQNIRQELIERFEKGTCNPDWIPMLGELGILAPTLSTDYGGMGGSALDYGIIMQEVERLDSGLRSMVSVQGSLAIYSIEQFGSEEQKKKFLPKMASGKWVGCFGLTEPNHGSDPKSMESKITLKNGKRLLSGQKQWITNSPIADVFVVWYKNEENHVEGAILTKDMVGLSAPEIHNKLSLRASVTGEIIMEEVEITESAILPLAKGLKAPLTCLSKARYGIAWGSIGAALDCFETALQYAKERIQFGKSIAGFQLVQKKLAEMATEITKAQLLAFRLAYLVDQEIATPAQISMAKRNNVRMALTTAQSCREICGAMGIVGEYPFMRHIMNLQSVLTYEGTEDIHLLITGQDLTGISAFN